MYYDVQVLTKLLVTIHLLTIEHTFRRRIISKLELDITKAKLQTSWLVLYQLNVIANGKGFNRSIKLVHYAYCILNQTFN